jgi:hypothetical protein
MAGQRVLVTYVVFFWAMSQFAYVIKAVARRAGPSIAHFSLIRGYAVFVFAYLFEDACNGVDEMTLIRLQKQEYNH